MVTPWFEPWLRFRICNLTEVQFDYHYRITVYFLLSRQLIALSSLDNQGTAGANFQIQNMDVDLDPGQNQIQIVDGVP